jgi:hypothetical protein
MSISKRFADAEIAASAMNTKRNIEQERMRPFRATVTAISSGLVSIQRGTDDDDEDAGYPVVISGIPAVGAEVVAINLGGAPLILGRLGPGATPTYTKQTGAGSTATTAGQAGGNDRNGVIELIPGGTGIASGAQVLVTFALPRATANYTIHLTPLTTAARTAGAAVGPTSRNTTTWTLTSDIALSSGSTYRWSYLVTEY